MMPSSLERPSAPLGRYAIHGEIASGGMATVHFGKLLGAAGFSRTVAIKRLHPQFAKDPEFVAMLADEARMAARIQHPNVVATLDVEAEGGEVFLIMEYVHGEALSRLIRAALRRGERVPPRIVASIMAGALHGLHAAHEAKNERGEPLLLVHRDISPQNILVGADGLARVLDFGVAKAVGRIQLTREGQIKGKLEYMPPEQLHGDALDRRSDVYAAGVVLWEALACERLFRGRADATNIIQLLTADVPPPSTRVPGLAPAFDDVTMRALRRDPAERFPSARDMALALERCGAMASLSEVGAWVELMAAESLGQRSRAIAQVESGAGAEEAAPPSFGDSRPVAIAAPATIAAPAAIAAPFTIAAPEDIATAITVRASTASPLPGNPAAAESMTLATAHALTSTAVPPQNRATSTPPSSPARPLTRRRTLFAVLGGALAASALLAVILRSGSVAAPEIAGPPSGARAAAALRPAIPSIPSASPESPAPPPDVAAAPAPVDPSSSPIKPTPAPTAATGATGATPAHGARARAVAAPPPKVSCNPPYTIDATGRKKYKRECF